jgi:hypothetical protein
LSITNPIWFDLGSNPGNRRLTACAMTWTYEDMCLYERVGQNWYGPCTVTFKIISKFKTWLSLLCCFDISTIYPSRRKRTWRCTAFEEVREIANRWGVCVAPGQHTSSSCGTVVSVKQVLMQSGSFWCTASLVSCFGSVRFIFIPNYK